VKETAMQIDDHTKIPGWGADLRPEARPGVPMEREPAAGVQAEPPPQRGVPAVHSVTMRMTPVYGTTLPPRGVSGAMRRAAYKIPEHRPSHWLLLLVADRVDVVEHLLLDLTRPRALLVGGGIVGLGVLGWLFSRRR
jgi:hypothetical protein